MIKPDTINERIDKQVVKTVLQPLKKEWKCKNISQVIERLFLEYKYQPYKKALIQQEPKTDNNL